MSSSKKRSNKTLSSQQSKRCCNNDNDLLFEEPQWIDIGNKSSWVWKYCGVKTDGRAYCRYIINENEETERKWNCKVIPYKESKQNELQCAVTDWIITDSQPFNA
ncbi:24536_t:CDS:2, partial [Gigaspora rosea]